MHDVIIVGGGLAGLTNSILLSRSGLKVLLLEKNKYPFHRVCGEYISNEVVPFLEHHDLYPGALIPSQIDRLKISAVSGRAFESILDLGGFGISRYAYDAWLMDKARASGVSVLDGTKVTLAEKKEDCFEVKTNKENTFLSQLVITAHGKRSKLDQTLDRSFIKDRSPYVGVKYHVKTDFPEDLIALHNFSGGYCGVSKVEGDTYNVCYMTHRDQLKKNGSIAGLEQNVLFQNPHLKQLFQNSEFLFEKPEVINEITFVKKEPVYNHLLMTGDSAGMITPLCGNGMAMAIHSAKILSEIIIRNRQVRGFDLLKIEQEYSRHWNDQFATRLWAGRQIQNLFGGAAASEVAVLTGKFVKPVTRGLIRQTHGEPFS